ncbi:Hypothetical protein CINCED_3A012812 [Cinara cedri]|uniref:Uncharacterized protein n=1 Tax=Cinara cedri TaxID=506608 RepID=A0A5E4NDX8_9HEMI|nr:Hypothetical protein CINCED_3A012812 [Cinara cedri]
MGNQLNSGQLDDAFTTKGFKANIRNRVPEKLKEVWLSVAMMKQKIVLSFNQGNFKELVKFLEKYNDETSYIRHHEQLSIIVRHFDLQKNRHVETLIGLKRMTSLNAESIYNMITFVLQQFSKDRSKILAVCFDEASTITGSISGVQEDFTQEILDMINGVGKMLNLEIHKTNLYEVLQKIFLISHEGLVAEIRILKGIPNVPNGLSTKAVNN